MARLELVRTFLPLILFLIRFKLKKHIKNIIIELKKSFEKKTVVVTWQKGLKMWFVDFWFFDFYLYKVDCSFTAEIVLILRCLKNLYPIQTGLFWSNRGLGGGCISPPPPYDFFLWVKIGECDTCHLSNFSSSKFQISKFKFFSTGNAGPFS